ncbi:hypothetical protein JCM12681A_66140 [Streptomyces mexicanus]
MMPVAVSAAAAAMPAVTAWERVMIMALFLLSHREAGSAADVRLNVHMPLEAVISGFSEALETGGRSGYRMRRRPS